MLCCLTADQSFDGPSSNPLGDMIKMLQKLSKLVKNYKSLIFLAFAEALLCSMGLIIRAVEVLITVIVSTWEIQLSVFSFIRRASDHGGLSQLSLRRLVVLGSHQRWKLHKNDPFYYDDDVNDVNDVNDVHNVNVVDDDDDAGKKNYFIFSEKSWNSERRNSNYLAL